MTNQMTETDLVAMACAGDERAFRDLIEPYRVRVHRFVAGMLKDDDRAQDIWQETILRVFRNLQHFDTTKKFQTWLYTIASNCAKNELRNRKRRNRVLIPMGELADEQGHEDRVRSIEDRRIRPDAMFEDRELGMEIDRALLALPPKHREVFVLREMRGQTYEQIAAATGQNLGTVKSRLFRARTALALSLG